MRIFAHLSFLDILLPVLAFVLMSSYAFVGSGVPSLFLSTHESHHLGYAWLGVTAAAMLSTAFLSGFSAKVAPDKLFSYCNRIFIFLLAFLSIYYLYQPYWAAYLLYVWKDIYIVVLVEQFWTLINQFYTKEEAKHRYGWFCASGSIGSIAAGAVLGFYAQNIGTYNTLWICLLHLVLLEVLVIVLRPILTLKQFRATPGSRQLAAPVQWRSHKFFLHIKEAWHVVRKSYYLDYLLLLVAVVQITMTVIDFQFSHMMKRAYPQLDERTAALGYWGAVINLVSLISQISNGWVLHVLGLPRFLLLLPLILSFGLILTGYGNHIGYIIGIRVLSKCIDYSWFRCTKEMLYLPLNYREKTQGKALVDIMTYRSVKGVSALFVLFGGAYLVQTGWAFYDLFLALIWLLLSVEIAKRYRKLTSVK